VTSLKDASGDFDDAIDQMRNAPRTDATAQRRVLNNVMACLYRLRNYRMERCGRSEYWRLADATASGQLVEAIVLVRGAGEHDFSRDVGPRTGYAYPGPRTFPSEDLHPDEYNRYWRPRAELEYDLAARDPKYGLKLAGYYDKHLADYLVLETLESARSFLVAAE
jgi:hypothetical protein